MAWWSGSRGDSSSSVRPRVSRRRVLSMLPVLAVAPAVEVLLPGAAKAGQVPDASGSTAWSTAGNAAAAGARLGTTTSQPLVLETAGVERARVTAAGRVGVGTHTPSAALSVAATNGAPAGTFTQGDADTDALTATSATTSSGNAVGAYLTADQPGSQAAAVYGVVSSTADTGATALWGFHAGAGVGVRGQVVGSGIGVLASTGAYNGLAASFANPHSSAGLGGVALRALGSQGSYAQLRRGTSGGSTTANGFGAGEFAGQLGVVGASSGETEGGAGVVGSGPDNQGVGVVGVGYANDYSGVEGDCTGPNGVGVFGSGNTGVEGYYPYFTGDGTGVRGTVASGQSVGVFAGAGVDSHGVPQLALLADGDAEVHGTLSKAGGAFKIDHPLDPAGKYLMHSFVESPDMLNVYIGSAVCDGDGTATITLPDWWPALNGDPHYQLTCVGGAAVVYVSRELTDHTFTIAGGHPGLKVCWQLTGVRQDAWARAHRIPVEVDKPPRDRGRFLHPYLQGPDAQVVTAIQVRTATAGRHRP